MRLFIAIPFPESLRLDITQWCHALAGEIPDPNHRLHWVKPEQLHLTLKFLGETSENQLPRLGDAIQTAVMAHHTFSLSLAKVGHFGGRVIWLGLDTGIEAVTQLAKTIEDHCESSGFVRENRHFHPHITLARAKTNPGTIRFSQLPTILTGKAFGPIHVSEICLIRSTLAPQGSLYETLRRFSLKN